MIYPRKLRQYLVQEINKPEVVVLTGMRQVGKTTLIREIFDLIPSENKVFLDLENPMNQRIFEEMNYDNILANLRAFNISSEKTAYFVLDEIQLMPGIVSAVKYLYDHYKIKFFLTGSSSFYLKNLFPESLAGRKILYELFPLTFQEFMTFKGMDKENKPGFTDKGREKNIVSYERYSKFFEEYMTHGGFPRVVLEPDNRRKHSVLSDIFTSYFEKDVQSIGDFKDMRSLRETILLLAARNSSKVEIAKLASEIGVTRNTIYSYLNFLEKTYFVFFLSPYTKNINGEVRGAKKVYVCDTGMLGYLGKVSEGTLFETSVFHLLRHYGKLNYFQKYKGMEIDFVLEGRIGFETKLTADQRDVRRLEKISSTLRLRDRYLITKNYSENEKTILGQDL